MDSMTYGKNWTELRNTILNASGNREEVLEEMFQAIQKYEASTFHPVVSILNAVECLAARMK